jgi:hypothetical protein
LANAKKKWQGELPVFGVRLRACLKSLLFYCKLQILAACLPAGRENYEVFVNEKKILNRL